MPAPNPANPLRKPALPDLATTIPINPPSTSPPAVWIAIFSNPLRIVDLTAISDGVVGGRCCCSGSDEEDADSMLILLLRCRRPSGKTRKRGENRKITTFNEFINSKRQHYLLLLPRTFRSQLLDTTCLVSSTKSAFRNNGGGKKCTRQNVSLPVPYSTPVLCFFRQIPMVETRTGETARRMIILSRDVIHEPKHVHKT